MPRVIPGLPVLITPHSLRSTNNAAAVKRIDKSGYISPPVVVVEVHNVPDLRLLAPLYTHRTKTLLGPPVSVIWNAPLFQ